MEKFVLNVIAKHAKRSGYQFLEGEYIETLKNELVRDHYKQLGFIQKEEKWILDLDNFQEHTTFIRLSPGSFYS